MTQKMIKYTVKEGRVAENEMYVTAVFEQLKLELPAGLSYAKFKLNDGVSFVHIVSYEAEEASNASRQKPEGARDHPSCSFLLWNAHAGRILAPSIESNQEAS